MLFAYGAPTTTRTPDLLITNQLLYQLSYKGETDGVALCTGSVCSYATPYDRMVENTGIEPMTYCVQSSRSPN